MSQILYNLGHSIVMSHNVSYNVIIKTFKDL